MRLSVIIPARNEAAHVGTTLRALQGLRSQRHEVILVDGGSHDDTLRHAQGLVDTCMASSAGRARQMNAGAAVARGEVLWFLHADTRITPGCAPAIVACCGDGDCWGRFDVRLSGRQPALRLVEGMMNTRSRLTGIATGDQGLFVSRRLFERVGGFPDLPLMEDIELSKRLRRERPPECLHQRLLTSSRRWEQHGIMRTVALMWFLRLAYFLGVPAERLALRYD